MFKSLKRAIYQIIARVARLDRLDAGTIEGTTDQEEGCEVCKDICALMAELTVEHPDDDPTTARNRLKDHTRAHPRRTEFEEHLAASAEDADNPDDAAFFRHLYTVH
jgi:hypothetical protein